MPRPVRNPTLAADGLPQEMYLDVRRACHKWLMQHDMQYRQWELQKARLKGRDVDLSELEFLPEEGPRDLRPRWTRKKG